MTAAVSVEWARWAHSRSGWQACDAEPGMRWCHEAEVWHRANVDEATLVWAPSCRVRELRATAGYAGHRPLFAGRVVWQQSQVEGAASVWTSAEFQSMEGQECYQLW